MTDKRREDDKLGRLAGIAVRNRYDPERLAALKRVISGKTRCPECDEPNRADQETCDRCGARLYPGNRKEEKKRRRQETE
jgi:rRNA maturation endonuclease Nob1